VIPEDVEQFVSDNFPDMVETYLEGVAENNSFDLVVCVDVDRGIRVEERNKFLTWFTSHYGNTRTELQTKLTRPASSLSGLKYYGFWLLLVKNDQLHYWPIVNPAFSQGGAA
jgi:hypothetical protein